MGYEILVCEFAADTFEEAFLAGQFGLEAAALFAVVHKAFERYAAFDRTHDEAAHAAFRTAFADLDASGFVKSELMQRNVIFNISGSADLSGLQHGDIFFQEGTLFWYDYTNNHGSRICSPVGDPQENTIYCLKGTGLFYRWDSTNSCFVPVNPQVMVSMGSTLDNAGNNGNTQVYVTLNAGDIYFDPSTSKIYYKKSSSVDIDLGAPSKLLIYANKQSNKLYRWSGSQMVELG